MLKGSQAEAVEVMHPTIGAIYVLRGDLAKFETDLAFHLPLVKQIKASILGVDVSFSPNSQYQRATREDNGCMLSDVVFNLRALRDKKHPRHDEEVVRWEYREEQI